MISQHADDVIVLWITYSVNIDRQAVQRHCWLYVFIRCVGGCSPYLILKRKKKIYIWGGGGGGGEKFLSFFSLLNIFFQKCSWGSETGGGGGGGLWGVWGAPRPHPGVVRGLKTIHFFL